MAFHFIFADSVSSSSSGTKEISQQVTTLKTNVIGLGNYINSVNRNVAGTTTQSIMFVLVYMCQQNWKKLP